MKREQRFGHIGGTISSYYGTYFLEEQCSDLFGSLAVLYTTGDVRIWSSSLPFSEKWMEYDIVIGFGNNGGVDIMYAKGELDSFANTNGSQRPALYIFDNYGKYHSSNNMQRNGIRSLWRG
ncbi:MAG: hypothetical protein HFG16_04450 [Erysipelotrichaceae bacterium]|jgi:hypothetical protein|nr:hypothetical protein [Erysipelotrichaceae bacterium]